MGELILHIGTTKTGSSSLQTFFFDNRKLLAKHNICFPEFTRQPEANPRRNGIFVNRLCVSLARGQSPLRGVHDPEENLERLARALSSGKRVLLTDENISSSEGWLFRAGYLPERFWRALAQTLYNAGAKDIALVVYLRRQDDWASSRWRESVKSGRCGESLEDFCNLPEILRTMDYASMLENARAAFGSEAKIAVRRYDLGAFEGGDIYRDFCSACDIPWDDRYRLPVAKENPSLSFDVAEALRRLKDEAPPNTPLRTDVLRPLAIKLSRNSPDTPGTTPFDEGAARELMEPYLAGNELISERHLDGEPLFSEECGGRPVWIPNEERIAKYRAAFEKAIERYGSRPIQIARIRALARKLPEGVKRPLKAARKTIFKGWRLN